MPKSVKLTIILETLSAVLMIVGIILITSACNPNKAITTTDTNTSSNESLNVDTVFQKKSVVLPFTGDSSTVSSSHVSINVIDSVVIRDSINFIDSLILHYKYVDVKNYKVNHPPVYTFTKYGYAKGWMDDNKLNVSMIVHDGVIQQEVDSLIEIITINKTKEKITTSTETTVTNEITFKDRINSFLIILAIIVMVVGLGYLGVKMWLKKWGKLW